MGTLLEPSNGVYPPAVPLLAEFSGVNERAVVTSVDVSVIAPVRVLKLDTALPPEPGHPDVAKDGTPLAHETHQVPSPGFVITATGDSPRFVRAVAALAMSDKLLTELSGVNPRFACFPLSAVCRSVWLLKVPVIAPQVELPLAV
jgi:hypothetical protein